jgi:hypothetical protein
MFFFETKRNNVKYLFPDIFVSIKPTVSQTQVLTKMSKIQYLLLVSLKLLQKRERKPAIIIGLMRGTCKTLSSGSG